MITKQINQAVNSRSESRPCGFLVDCRKYQFVTDDDRIRNRENVTLTVANAGSPEEAKQMVCEFLKDVERRGLTIE